MVNLYQGRTLKVSNNACFDSLSDIIHTPVEDIGWLPNAFSPNNDGINNEFRVPHPTPELLSFSLKIYNRWGSLVYESDNIEQPWIPTDISSSGVYVYVIRYVDMYHNSHIKSGSVLLTK